MELEIDEGVSKIQKANKPKVWLHWLLFIIGSLGAIDTWLKLNGSEGIFPNFFLEGLINIFGPFMLWVGGATLLGRLGAAGPRIMQFFLSEDHPLLSDVKRGLKGSGSAESVNRLATICYY